MIAVCRRAPVTRDQLLDLCLLFDRGAPRSAIPVIHYTATRPATARLVFTVFL